MPDAYHLEDTGESLPRAVTETELPGLTLLGRGKVRDIYDLEDRLLIIATDRISAFDSVLGTPIPDKGRVLTQLSLFWFDLLGNIIPNHFLTEDLAGLPTITRAAERVLRGRSMIVRKADPLPVECVVRGYLAGSGWRDYQESGAVCGIPLRQGYRQAEELDEPIFTPATKAASGHDENISFTEMGRRVGEDLAWKMRDAALQLYGTAAAHARERGVIIADTKFEFGLADGELVLIDEVLTPDSSRFWDAATYEVGANPPSFDKQYVRDWLDNESGWNHEPPAPSLPRRVVQETRAKYRDGYRRITGHELPD